MQPVTADSAAATGGGGGGGGTVTSILAGSGITVTPNPITSTGSVALTDVPTATPGANKVPKAGVGGQLAIGFLASGTPTGSKFVRDDGTLATPAGAGDVVGPVGATADNFASFDGVTGKIIKDSGKKASDFAAAGAAPALHAATHAAAGGTDPITITEAQVTNLATDLAAKAPLASPALTGTPTVPTAAFGTSTTQAASTAFVQAAATAANTGWINVKNPAYGATGDGVTDDTAAILAAIKAARPAGGIDRIYMTAFGSGYTANSAITLVGMDSGASGFAGTALVSDPGASGVIGSVSITTRGTGYNVYSRQVGLTSGSPTATMSDTSGLTVGMSVDHAYTAGLFISAITPGVSVTMTGNATGAFAFCQVAFGIPRVSTFGGAGTGAAGDVICGNGSTVFFPPGVYRITTLLEITGKHNLTLYGPGATIYQTGGGDGLTIEEFCRAVDVIGLKIVHTSTIYGNDRTRGSGCGIHLFGSLCTLLDCATYDAPEFGILVGRNETGPKNYGNRIINPLVVQSCGDGIHATNGTGGLVIENPVILSPGDDAFGIVADGTGGNPPENVSIHNYRVENGGWRAFALLGCKNVTIGAGIVNGTIGHGVELGTWNAFVPANIVWLGGHTFLNIGTQGTGGPVGSRQAFQLGDLVGGFFGTGYVNGASGYGVSFSNMTDVRFADQILLNCTSGEWVNGGGHTRVTVLYNLAGALTYIGGSGTTTTVAPA